jgi:hypothetical protein
VSAAFITDPLLTLSDPAFTKLDVVHVTVLAPSMTKKAGTVNESSEDHVVPESVRFVAATQDLAVQVVLSTTSDVTLTASDATTVLELARSTDDSTLLFSSTTDWVITRLSNMSGALPLAGTVTFPTLVNAVVGLLSSKRVRRPPMSV